MNFPRPTSLIHRPSCVLGIRTAELGVPRPVGGGSRLVGTSVLMGIGTVAWQQTGSVFRGPKQW